jgi:methionyl-tRNA synthetase
VRLQEVCTVVLNLFRQLCVYLAPVLPRLAAGCGRLLQSEITAWSDSQTPIFGTPISKFEHLMQRVDVAKVQQMIEESKDTAAAPAVATPASPNTPEVVAGAIPATGVPVGDSAEPLQLEPLAPTCTIDDFIKVDLRVARVVKAEEVPEAKSLSS